MKKAKSKTKPKSNATSYAAVGRLLKSEIKASLPKASLKKYHGIPVWFIGGNAVVGLGTNKKKGVTLLFWNGQALKEPALKAVGKFHAAQIQFQHVNDIHKNNLRRWVKKAEKKIWDYSGLRKKGALKARSKK